MPWGSGGIAPLFLILALDGGNWSASRPGRSTREEISGHAHWIGGTVGPRAGMDSMESNSGRPVAQPIAFRYTDNAMPSLCISGIRKVIIFVQESTQNFP
jgi:hypothetical protein